jgi:hypothetical protein
MVLDSHGSWFLEFAISFPDVRGADYKSEGRGVKASKPLPDLRRLPCFAKPAMAFRFSPKASAG